MTEKEYVEHLRKCAATYIANLDNDKTLDVFAGAASDWHNAKTSMSPWTMVSLCDAWLAANNTENKDV